MSIEPEEHDYIGQVIAEDAAKRVPRRLSDDPAVRLAECRGQMAEQVRKASDACDAGLPILEPIAKSWPLLDEDVLRDLASSAYEIALSNGVNEEAFLRLARTVEQRARSEFANVQAEKDALEEGWYRDENDNQRFWPEEMETLQAELDRLSPAFDETAERLNFEEHYASMNEGFCPSAYDGEYDFDDCQSCWLSWLACARQKAEEGK